MSMLRLVPTLDHLFREMNRFQRDFDSVVGRTGRGVLARNGFAAAYPTLNLWEDAEHVFAEAERPGYRLEDLEVFVVGPDQLVLKGERKPIQPENAVCHRQERTFGNFQRSVTLPSAVDDEKVEAKLEQGVLTVQLA